MSENKENIENTEKDIEGNNGNKSKPVKKRPTLEMLEAELKKEQNKSNFSRILKSTIFSLVVVAAVAVLVAVLVLPVLQISGVSMTNTLQDGDIVVAVNSKKFETGDVIAFYYNNRYSGEASHRLRRRLGGH